MARTVAITGAGSGIGRAIAGAFIGEGDIVVAGDISNERVERVVEDLGAGAIGLQVDVADREAFSRFLQAAEDHGDGLDVLVNNAGVFDAFAGLFDTDDKLWQRVLDINLTGCFHGCQLAARLMRPRGRGRILNISSIAAFRGGLDGLAYTASKAGILGLTRRAAFDVGRDGITVNAICPGAVATEIRQNSAEILGWRQGSMDDKGVGVTMPPDMFEYQVPVGRSGDPSEVAAVAVFLASDRAAYVNGESIAVDGGWAAI